MDGLKRFLQEYWLWILIPAVLVGAALAWLLMSGGDSGGNPYGYNLF